MRVYVVDNGGQWTHREWRVLKYLKVETKIIPNTTPFDQIGEVDALVLSGGSLRTWPRRPGAWATTAIIWTMPISPFWAYAPACSSWPPISGEAPVLPSEPSSDAPALYVDEEDLSVPRPPQGLRRLGIAQRRGQDRCRRASRCWRIPTPAPVEAMRSLDRPLYGLQFHPEVENTEFGMDIFHNFLKVVEEWHR